MKSFILNDKNVNYDESTMFQVQVAKLAGGGYKNKVTTPNPAVACVIYNGINIDDKHKKRIIMFTGLNRPKVLVREI